MTLKLNSILQSAALILTVSQLGAACSRAETELNIGRRNSDPASVIKKLETDPTKIATGQVLSQIPRSKGTILPQCTVSTAPGGPRLWRLSATQWKNSYFALGVTADVSGLAPDSRAGRYDSSPAGFTFGQQNSIFFQSKADEYAPQVVKFISQDVPCAKTDINSLSTKVCQDKFVSVAIERIFRRPASTDEKTRFGTLFESLIALEKPQEGANDLVAMLLKSPHFLIRVFAPELDGSNTKSLLPYAVASHISFGLTDFPPDKELMAAAATADFLTAGQLDNHSRRLIKTTAGEDKFVSFSKQWLRVNVKPGNEPQRDIKLFPDYSAQIFKDMTLETETFLRNEILAKNSSIRSVFSSGSSTVTGRLEAYYKKMPPSNVETPKQDVDFSDAGRFGILTHGSVLTNLSSSTSTHVIHRANLIRSHFLCSPISGPPADALLQDMQGKKVLANATERMKFEEFVNSARADCAACHKTFVPFGLALENYDADGRFRTMSNGLKIDSSGVISSPSGDLVSFESGQSFLKQISEWNTTAQCTLMHSLEFHWGDARAAMSCPTETVGKTLTVDTPFLDVYLAPLTNPQFYQAW